MTKFHDFSTLPDFLHISRDYFPFFKCGLCRLQIPHFHNLYWRWGDLRSTEPWLSSDDINIKMLRETFLLPVVFKHIVFQKLFTCQSLLFITGLFFSAKFMEGSGRSTREIWWEFLILQLLLNPVVLILTSGHCNRRTNPVEYKCGL